MICEVSAKTILKRDTLEMPLEAVKQGKKCLVFSSNGYSDFYLRHTSSIVLATVSYRPKFLQSYREAVWWASHALWGCFRFGTLLDESSNLCPDLVPLAGRFREGNDGFVIP